MPSFRGAPLTRKSVRDPGPTIVNYFFGLTVCQSVTVSLSVSVGLCLTVYLPVCVSQV